MSTYNGYEVYPMPFFATLGAADPEALATWYERTLGFGRMFAGPIIHLRRAKYQDLLIAPGEGTSLHLAADDDLEKLGPVVKTPWNTREVRITDPNGRRLVFFQRDPDPDPENVKRWQMLLQK